MADTTLLLADLTNRWTISDTTLLLAGVTVLAVAMLYFFVGRAVLDPEASRAERWARNAFGLWWFALAARTVREGAGNLLVVMGIEDVALHTSLEYLSLVFLFVGLTGLMYYLLYLYIGRTWVLYPIAAFYGVFLFLGFYVTNLRNPTGLDVGTWSVELEHASAVSPLLLDILLGALLVPLVIAVFLYLLLHAVVAAPVQKARIRWVGGALLFWFASVGIAVATNLNELVYWGFISRVVAGIAAVAILYSFTGLEKQYSPTVEATEASS